MGYRQPLQEIMLKKRPDSQMQKRMKLDSYLNQAKETLSQNGLKS